MNAEENITYYYISDETILIPQSTQFELFAQHLSVGTGTAKASTTIEIIRRRSTSRVQ